MEHSTHFHRVETALWFEVSFILRQLAKQRVINPAAQLAEVMPSHAAIDIAQFLRQMEVGYLHPRRTSLHFKIHNVSRPESVCQSFNAKKPK